MASMERKTYKMKCPNPHCNYTYKIETDKRYSMELCPNCGYSDKFNRFIQEESSK
jgi:predicted RNA-binding Zn-ribbon protein involved in translation (DUF1610 family)